MLELPRHVPQNLEPLPHFFNTAIESRFKRNEKATRFSAQGRLIVKVGCRGEHYLVQGPRWDDHIEAMALHWINARIGESSGFRVRGFWFKMVPELSFQGLTDLCFWHIVPASNQPLPNSVRQALACTFDVLWLGEPGHQ